MTRGTGATRARGVVAAIALALLALPSAASAAHYSVSNTNDVPAQDPSAGDCATPPASAAGGECTLRSAIQAANHATAPSTITLAGGTYTLTIAPSGPDDDSTGDLNITQTGGKVTIAGEGAASTIIDGNFLDRVFRSDSGTDVEITGVTVRNGRAGTLGNVTECPDHTLPGAYGGGMQASGALALSDDVFDGNFAIGAGGGVYSNGGANDAVTLTRVTLKNNKACQPDDDFTRGGGMAREGGHDVTIDSSLIDGNDAINRDGSRGGGIASTGDQNVTITNTTLSNNHAGDGGALSAEQCCANGFHLFADLVSGNTADGNGGALSGGGNNTVVNTTITNNSSGIGMGCCHTSISYSTLYANGDYNIENLDSGDFDYDDSIFGGTKGNNCPLTGGTSNGNNLFDDTSDSGAQCGATSSDLVAADVKVGPLADNGGPTMTRALHFDSPAIDKGNSGACTQTAMSVDQRAFDRPQGSGCDIGAYEYFPPDVSVSSSVDKPVITLGDHVTFTDVVRSDGVGDSTSVNFHDPSANFTIDSVTPSQGSCTHTATSVSCDLGAMAKDATATIKIDVTPTSVGTLTLTATVGMAERDPTPRDNTDSASVEVVAPQPGDADLRVVKSAKPDKLKAGHKAIYTVTVTNHGPATAVDAKLTDKLPAGLEKVAVKTTRGSCAGSTTITCSLGDMKVGASATISIKVLVANRGTFVNSTSVSSRTHDPVQSNNADTAGVAARCAPPPFRVLYDRDDRVVRVEVRIGKRRVLVRTGHSLSRTIKVPKLPQRGTHVVRAIVKLDDRRIIIQARRFRGCVAGKLRQHIPFVPGIVEED